MFIKKTQDDNVETWIIDRTDRFNGLGTTLAQELKQLLNGLDKVRTRILVLRAKPRMTNKGPVWLAGGDLQELAALTDPAPYVRQMHRICLEISDLPMPVISVVEGLAIGGGAEFALAADIRIGNDHASFYFKQMENGLATGYGGGRRLCQLVGLAKAQKYFFHNSNVDTATALQDGLLHDVAPSNKLEQHLSAQIDGLLDIHAPSLAAQKQLLDPNLGEEEANQKFLGLWGNPVHRSVLRKFKRD